MSNTLDLKSANILNPSFERFDDNLADILLDALAGDPKALERPEIQSLGADNVKAALQWLATADINNDYRSLLMDEGWRLTYKRKPPTPAEFLTAKYIGDSAETIWPHIKEVFLRFMDNDPLNPKRNLALSPSIGWGKSFLSNLVMGYLTVLFGLMWAPYRTFGHSKMTVYAIGMSGSTISKANELLLEPFQQFIEGSPYFEKCARRDDLLRASEEDPDHIYYTTATRSSAFQFTNNLTVKIPTTPTKLLGVTFLSLCSSEIGWWTDAGWQEEDVKTFFTKGLQRIASRMQGNYFGRYIIDSSPHSMEGYIDKFVWNTAMYDPTWEVVTGSRWKFFKNDFKHYYNPDGTEKRSPEVAFRMYKGAKSEPPKVLESDTEAQMYNQQDIVWCPKKSISSKGTLNLESLAKTNPYEFLRDYAGIPAGNSDRIFAGGPVIENIFDNDLRNIYTSIVADAANEPEHLIWNQIKDKFFINFKQEYMFYREPGAKRVLAVDQSTSGDATAITMAHWEYVIDEEKASTDKVSGDDVKNVMVADFNIVIIPKGGKINLEAIKCFILDLIDLGNINLRLVNFDNFQSDTTRQALKRRGIELDYISADKKNEPYQALIDYITHERFFAGKNIFLKNNLMAIHWTKRESGSTKIDHFNGQIVNESEDTNWDTSLLGINAKDVADTCAECLTMLLKHDLDFAPTSKWINTKYAKKASVEDKLKKLNFCF